MKISCTFTEQTPLQGVKEIGKPIGGYKGLQLLIPRWVSYFKGDGINLRQPLNLKYGTTGGRNTVPIAAQRKEACYNGGRFSHEYLSRLTDAVFM